MAQSQSTLILEWVFIVLNFLISSHFKYLDQGTGPWNLELQVVGPRSSENLQIEGVKDSRKTLQIPIPKAVDNDGGNFEINIGSCSPISSAIPTRSKRNSKR